MNLEQIINKAKNIGKKITLFGSLSLLPIITGCDSIQQPLGLNINAAVTQSQETNFKGDTLYSSIRPLKQPYHEIRVSVAKPNSSWNDWETLTKKGLGTYTKTISGNEIGEYFTKFQIKNNYDWIDEEGSHFNVHMDEAHSDDVANNKITPLVVNPITAQDGEIIDMWHNINWGVGGTMYEHDFMIRVKDSTAGGGQRLYSLDIQGSIDNTYDSQKETDAKASGVSYKHLGLNYTLSDFDLRNKIDDINFEGWKKTF